MTKLVGMPEMTENKHFWQTIICLLRTIAKTNDGKIVYIPNLKFSESVILISKD